MMVTRGLLGRRFAFVRISSPGPPMLVLPGLTLDNDPPGPLLARGYAFAFRRLAAARELWVVQRPRGLEPGTSLAEVAGDYAGLIGRTWGRVDVMGLSTGGLLAQHLALDAPERVRRLVLVVSGARLGEEGQRICRRWLALAAAGSWRELRRDQAAAAVDGKAATALSRMATAGPTASAAPDPRDAADFTTLTAADLRHDTLHRLPYLDVPTLLVGGSLDPFFPADVLRATARAIPDAALAIHDGAGHGLPKRHARILQEQVREFVVPDRSHPQPDRGNR